MRRASRAAPPDADAERVAELERRVADLEAVCGALARAVIFAGLAPDVRQLPANRRIDNRADAALIRTTAQRRP